MSDTEKDAAFAKAFEAIMRGAAAAKSMPNLDLNHTATEVAPGHIVITCNHSKLPLERTNEFGTFCNSDDCECEKQSKEIAKAMGDFFPGHRADDA